MTEAELIDENERLRDDLARAHNLLFPFAQLAEVYARHSPGQRILAHQGRELLVEDLQAALEWVRRRD